VAERSSPERIRRESAGQTQIMTRVLAAWTVLSVAASLVGSAQSVGPVESRDRTVVFSADRAHLLAKQCSRPAPGPVQGAWLPGAASIRQVEEGLGAAFDAAVEQAGTPVADRRPLPEYHRQYGGLVVGGRRIVYVNAFHERLLQLGLSIRPPRPVDWRHVAVNVCDGWTSYFGAEFDVGSGKITALVFNGRAG
jgi:hypothetical protein